MFGQFPELEASLNGYVLASFPELAGGGDLGDAADELKILGLFRPAANAANAAAGTAAYTHPLAHTAAATAPPRHRRHTHTCARSLPPAC
jgi:hypothetical protein